VTGQIWQLAGVLGALGWCVYIHVSLAIRLLRDFGYDRPEWLRSVRAELKPFALPFLIATYVPDIVAKHHFWDYFWFGLGIVAWLIYRHDKDDDDRWKRRLEKLSGRVAVVGGRLKVVPVGASQ
jgi:hypothetical protein